MPNVHDISRRSLLAALPAVAAAPVRLPGKTRVALIGLDGHPSEVTKPLPQLPDVEMVGLFDPNPKSISQFQKNPRLAGAKTYTTDWRAMVDETKPDVVGVCNANSLHAAIIVECLGRGIHVIGEKPIATEPADLERVRKAVESGKAKFTSMLPMRFSPAYQALRDIARSGELGEIIQMDAQKSYKVSTRPEWFYKRSTYGGTMAWIGIHMIDLMIYTSGRDFTEAFGYQNHIGFDETGDTENITATTFRLDNGGVALLRMDYLRPSSAITHGDDRLRLAGSKGIAEYTEATGVTVMTGSRKPERLASLPAERSLFSEFLDHIYNGKAAPIPWKEILRGHQVALAARDAMESGKPRKI
jgi:predicted dehydrogenase